MYSLPLALTKLCRLLAVLVLLTVSLSACQPIQPPIEGAEAAPVEAGAYWPTTAWRTTTPEEQGMDSAKLAQALLTIRQRQIPIHSLLIIRDGSVLLDASFYPYDGSTVHDFASVTKSVMTTLTAIAAEQGLLDLDAPMVSFFPEYAVANMDSRKESITVRNLANMASGLDSVGLAEDEGSLREMQATDNYVQWALNRKAVWEPGTQFVYDSPGMHLLSAILQQATGMTALEFAEENLFGPLGITDVIWEADEQGFTHGWGDLHLKPRDAARLGYLWLNNGAWDGKQIVSSEWMHDAVQPLLPISDGDYYGYGWWVNPEDNEFSAQGRGGQQVIVVPNFDAILVTTGGGFDYGDVDPLVLAAIVDLEKRLPTNAAAVAELDAALAEVLEPPAATPVAPLPAIAKEISGKLYALGPNPVELDAVGLDFDDSAEAKLLLVPTGSDQTIAWPIGLDGVLHFSPGDNGLMQGQRGSWVDDKTFLLEVDEVANNSHGWYRMTFEGDHVTVEGSEAAHEVGVRFEGTLLEPRMESERSEVGPPSSPPELSLESLVGLWEHGCITSEIFADGTYKAWNGRPQPGGFPKEAGTIELDGTLLTFHSGDGGLMCRSQSGTYEVVAWSGEEFDSNLVQDECVPRSEGAMGVYRRLTETVPETDSPSEPFAETASVLKVDTDLPYATETMSDGSTRVWTLDRYLPAQPGGALKVVYFYGAGGAKEGEALLARAMAEQGAEVVVVDFPNFQPDMALENGRDGFRRMLQSGACAVAFVEGDVGRVGEPGSVVLAGFSLGAGLAAQLALGADDLSRYWEFFAPQQGESTSSITCESGATAAHVVAFVGFAGAYDFFVGHEGKWGREWLAEHDPELLQFLTGSVGENSGLAFCLYHGDADSVIPYENSQAFADLLQQEGYSVDLVEFAGDHSVLVEQLTSAIREIEDDLSR
jgi:CubicO group peptidase (beta-lactamase class C family)/acetyl esterase/lipase